MMAGAGKGRTQAHILPGPGLTRRPEAVKRAVESQVREIIADLELIANCPELALDLAGDLGPEARLARFCEALAHMALPLMLELRRTHEAACADEKLDPAAHRALLERGGHALAEYFVGLASIHGVAFASDRAPPRPSDVARALAALERELMAAL